MDYGKTAVTVAGISKSFGDLVLDNINFTVDEDEIVVLLGPSGCGKNNDPSDNRRTQMPDSGMIICTRKRRNETARSNARNWSHFSVLHALFQKMTVEENIGYGLRLRRRENEIRKRSKQADRACASRGTSKKIAFTAFRRPTAARRYRSRSCIQCRSSSF